MLKTQIQRVYRRTLREISKVSFVKRRSDAVYQARLDQFSGQLSPVTPSDRPIADALEHKGIFITTLSDLKLQSTSELLQGVSCILLTLSTVPTSAAKRGEFLIKAPNDHLLQHPALFRWGLEERLLNIVENYLKLPVAYHGVYFRRDLANGVTKRTRLWHLDKEDRTHG